MSRNFKKTAIFHFWAKLMLLLNPFSAWILWKINIKKPTLNGYILKTRVNSESKLKFSESAFNFLQKSVVFYTLYLQGRGLRHPQPPAPQPVARNAQRVKKGDSYFKVREIIYINFQNIVVFSFEITINIYASLIKKPLYAELGSKQQNF